MNYLLIYEVLVTLLTYTLRLIRLFIKIIKRDHELYYVYKSKCNCQFIQDHCYFIIYTIQEDLSKSNILVNGHISSLSKAA